MTARTAPSVKAMGEALKGRLSALAKAHELIGPAIKSDLEHSENASIRPLIEKVIRPHMDPNGEHRIELDGPEIELGANASTSLALIFHELATNAAKYGALSSPEGHISINWSVPNGLLELEWKEHVSKRKIQPPKSSGFGSTLARASASGQLGGSISFDWRPGGLHIKLNAPLERLQR